MTLHAYKHVFAELTIVDEIVMRGDCIVVPERLRMRMLDEGHQGQVRTKQLLRPGGGLDTPLYGLYRYVLRNRVWFLEVLDP